MSNLAEGWKRRGDSATRCRATRARRRGDPPPRALLFRLSQPRDNRGGPLSWRARGGGIGREPRSRARDAQRGLRRHARFPAARERRGHDPLRETSRPRGDSPNPFPCTLRVDRKSGAMRQSRKSGHRRAMTHLRGARCVRMRTMTSQMYLTPRDARLRRCVSDATRALRTPFERNRPQATTLSEPVG